MHAHAARMLARSAPDHDNILPDLVAKLSGARHPSWPAPPPLLVATLFQWGGAAERHVTSSRLASMQDIACPTCFDGQVGTKLCKTSSPLPALPASQCAPDLDNITWPSSRRRHEEASRSRACSRCRACSRRHHMPSSSASSASLGSLASSAFLASSAAASASSAAIQ